MSSVILATPVSHLFENEGDAKAIIEVSDCLEARERTVHLRYPRRFLFHVDIDLTQKWDEEKKVYLQQSIEQIPDLKLITFQATVNCDQPLLREGKYFPGGETLTIEQMKQNAGDNVFWLRSILPRGVIIGLENNNYYPTPAYEVVTDADFLKSIIEDTDIKLLLDIAHAFVTAHNKNISLESYLAELPMDRCLQVHLCQPLVRADGLAVDAHEVPHGELRDLTREIIKEYAVTYLTVEYYKDVDNLISTLQEERRYFD